MKPYLYMGTSPDSCDNYRIDIDDIKPFKKYYWYVLVRDWNDYYNTAQSEVRSFYYATCPQITKIYNVEGDWAAIVKWEQSDYMKASKLTLTPDKECKYDNTPIDLSAMTDSCYISAGDEFDSKYAVYHQWWDDTKAQYYEPVVYGFNITFDGEIDGHSFSVTSDTVKYIFLDRAKYAADKYFNIYRMGQIGNRTWLLEDLRGSVQIEGTDRAGLNWFQINSKLLVSPLGFKAMAYYVDIVESDKALAEIIPAGFHLATDDDWQDLEYTYGLRRTKTDEYKKWSANLAYYVADNIWKGKYTNDTVFYVGQKEQLFYKLISDKEWETPDSAKSLLNGQGGFNVRPYGIIESGGIGGKQDVFKDNCATAYLTTTTNGKDDNGYPIHCIRFFWSGNTGVARIWNICSYHNMYMFRCVKDE